MEEERRRVEEEAARLEAERQAALMAKEELARQAEDQMKTQEQLVSGGQFYTQNVPKTVTVCVTEFFVYLH